MPYRKTSKKRQQKGRDIASIRRENQDLSIEEARRIYAHQEAEKTKLRADRNERYARMYDLRQAPKILAAFEGALTRWEYEDTSWLSRNRWVELLVLEGLAPRTARQLWRQLVLTGDLLRVGSDEDLVYTPAERTIADEIREERDVEEL